MWSLGASGEEGRRVRENKRERGKMDSRRNRLAHTIASVVIGAGVFLLAGRGAMGQTPSARPSITGDDARPLYVGVGKSKLIEVPWPVSRVSVSKPEIADVEVLSPHQVLVMGNVLGVTDLILWNEDEQAWRARVNVVLDLQSLQDDLKHIFPESELELVQSQDIVVVTGSLRRAEQAAQLGEVLAAYGVVYVDTTSVAGVQQVLLQVRIAEASRQAIRSLGINAIYAGNDFFGVLRIGSDAGGPINPASILPEPGAPIGGPIPFLLGDTGVSGGVTLLAGIPSADLLLFIEALAENQYVRVLAEPSLIALSGEEASFLAGGEFPVPIVQGSSAGGGTSITVEYKEFGVRLNFRPLVLGDGTIRLYVNPEVSELSEFGAVRIEGFSIPSLLTRRVSTTLELKSGQTFAMAGLLKQTNTARNSRIPFLGDLPILGPLFRSVRYTQGETELIVLVTASLVEPISWAEARRVPGDLYRPPSDWELYINGQIEASAPPALPPADAARLKELGLDRLRGPGAWDSYEQRLVVRTPVRRTYRGDYATGLGRLQGPGAWGTRQEPGGESDTGVAAPAEEPRILPGDAVRDRDHRTPAVQFRGN